MWPHVTDGQSLRSRPEGVATAPAQIWDRREVSTRPEFLFQAETVISQKKAHAFFL